MVDGPVAVGSSSSGGGNRAEADRWLVTSEKLLASNDLHGAKTFAIRAVEADPTRSQAADYILAICDVLIAGDTRIGTSNLPDWYGILRLSRLAQNPEFVTAQYRRLALLLNPSVNRLPFADRAFKLVADAWYIFSDQSRKSNYDRDLQIGQSSSQTEPLAKSFWTACPYCFVLYEYPKVYEECTFRCQNCKRSFEAVTIQKPPVEEKGKDDVYFCSWAVFPIGFSGGYKTPSWSPISPLFACPIQKVDKKRKETAPTRIYYDNDDVYVAISDDDDDDDDDDWREEEGRLSKRKGKETVRRGNVESISGSSNPATDVGSSSGVKSNRKRTVTGGKNVGRLDLNVEFSNEGEETNAASVRRNEGLENIKEVDNMEGIGFFEGLDEFLSSLPILSVVGDDKIKAT